MFLNRSEQLFGRNRFTITSSETVRIMKSICSISAKILSVGATTYFYLSGFNILMSSSIAESFLRFLKELFLEKAP